MATDLHRARTPRLESSLHSADWPHHATQVPSRSASGDASTAATQACFQPFELSPSWAACYHAGP
eukprot:7883701-Pyramimonas_sp.AAC.1